MCSVLTSEAWSLLGCTPAACRPTSSSPALLQSSLTCPISKQRGVCHYLHLTAKVVRYTAAQAPVWVLCTGLSTRGHGTTLGPQKPPLQGLGELAMPLS